MGAELLIFNLFDFQFVPFAVYLDNLHQPHNRLAFVHVSELPATFDEASKYMYTRASFLLFATLRV